MGNSPSSRRLVVRRPPPSKPIIPSPLLPVDSASRTSGPEVSAFAVSARVRAGTRAVADMPGLLGLPGQRAHREPVAVGRGQGDLVALDLHADAGEHGQGVVATGGERDLRHGSAEDVALQGPRCRRHRRERRVVLHRQRRQGEAGRAAGERRRGGPPAGARRAGRAGIGRCLPGAGRGRAPARAPRRWRPRRSARRPRSRTRSRRGRPRRSRAAGPAGPASAAGSAASGPSSPPRPRARRARPSAPCRRPLGCVVRAVRWYGTCSVTHGVLTVRSTGQASP